MRASGGGKRGWCWGGVEEGALVIVEGSRAAAPRMRPINNSSYASRHASTKARLPALMCSQQRERQSGALADELCDH
jgi:hypothetical protein